MKFTQLLTMVTLLTNYHLAFSQTFTFRNVNLQGMGYVTGIIAHSSSGDVYARTDVFGIYRWDRNLAKWLPLQDGKVTTGNVESFAIDNRHAGTIYTINGHNQAGRLYKTTDKGISWQELPDFQLRNIQVSANGSWRGGGERLATDPNGPEQVLFFGSRNAGLWRSANGGASWAQIPLGSLPAGSAGGVTFVVIDPSSGHATQASQKIYAGVQGLGVYQSINGGTSWSLLSGGPSTSAKPCRASIAANGTLYISYASSDGGGASGFVYKYTGSGNLVNVTPSGKSAEGFWGISVDPANANRVAAMQWNPQNGNGIHFSSNGGSSWSSSGFSRPTTRTEPSWYPSWAGWTYASALSMDPLNASQAWLGTGFGVYFSSNIAASPATWTARMNNFEELVVNTVKCPPLTGGADLLVGIADMQGFRVNNRNNVPENSFEPEGFGIVTGIAWCESDPSFVVSVGGNQNNGPDGESNTPKYRFSSNNGQSWQAFTAPTATSVNGNIAVSATEKLRWVIAPKDRSGSFNDPHFTTNGGATWTRSNGTPANTENGCTEQWSSSEFLVADKVNGMKFYYYCDRQAGNWQSGFYMSQDGGANFTLMSGSLPANYRSSIGSVPGKEGHVFFCSKTGSQLYRTTNNGQTWQTLPAITQCRAIGFGQAIAPSTEPTLFMYGAVDGVLSLYRSTDYGLSWTNINDGSLPQIISSVSGDMRDGNIVYLGTGGRGVIYGESGTTIPVSVSGVTLSQSSLTLQVGQSQQLSAQVLPSNASNKNVTWSVANSQVATVSSSGFVTGISPGQTNITVTTADGAYTANCSINVTAGNIALGKPAIASSQQSSNLSPANAVDGSLNTLWQSTKTNSAWIRVDLGATFQINQVTLRWGSVFARGYQLQLSGDGVNWTPIYTIGSATGNVHQINASGSGRYIRLSATARSANNNGYQLREFEVYGTPVGGNRLQLTGNEPITIYPNPARGMIQIRIGNSESLVSIFDAAGRQICNAKGIGSMSIPVYEWPRGWYVVMVQRGNERFTQKVMLE